MVANCLLGDWFVGWLADCCRNYRYHFVSFYQSISVYPDCCRYLCIYLYSCHSISLSNVSKWLYRGISLHQTHINFRFISCTIFIVFTFVLPFFHSSYFVLWHYCRFLIMNSIESIAKSLNIQHFRYASIYLGFKMSLAAIELANEEQGGGGGGVRQNKN